MTVVCSWSSTSLSGRRWFSKKLPGDHVKFPPLLQAAYMPAVFHHERVDSGIPCEGFLGRGEKHIVLPSHNHQRTGPGKQGNIVAQAVQFQAKQFIPLLKFLASQFFAFLHQEFPEILWERRGMRIMASRRIRDI